jgi:hypothetical protein
MKTLVNIVRYGLADRTTYLWLPWAILAVSFLINVAISAQLPAGQGDYTGGLLTIYAYLFVCGAMTMTRSLPFGLMLGVSRRSYYLGTALLIAALGVVYGLALTVLQAVERVTSGWGVGLHFFRVAWIMDGPWYQTWLMSFVLLVLFFLYGMWYGLVWRRWNLIGLVSFIAAQLVVVLVVVVAVSKTSSWSAFGHFFATITAPTLTGVLAALTVALGLGGLATIRRVTI